MVSGPMVISGAVGGVSLPETSAQPGSPFGSIHAPSYGAPYPTFGAANPSSETPLFQLSSLSMGGSHSGLNMLQAAQVAPLHSGTGMVQPVSGGGSPQIGFNMNPTRVGVGLSGFPAGNPLSEIGAEPLLSGAGMVQSSFFGGSHHLGGSIPQAGGGVPLQPQLLSGSGFGETMNKNKNPFLF